MLAERQVAASLIAAGAREVTLPSLSQAREDFDASLVEPPQVVSVLSVEQRELHEALGV